MKQKSLKDRLKKKQEDIRKRGEGNSGMIFLKPDTTLRVRLLPLNSEEDFTLEVVHFYLGDEIKGVISPATFNEPCAIMERYEELKKSKNPEDKELAKKFVPKRKFVALVNAYTDTKGKEVDPEKTEKLILLPNSIAQQLIDFYLDEDDWGDMTNPETGYDVKLKRVGSGKMDTEYSCSACNKTPIGKKFHKVYDLTKAVRAIMPTYEDTQDKINSFLHGDAGKKEKKSGTERLHEKKKKKKSL